MDLPVRSDDVLSQRTRARIFAWLVTQLQAGALIKPLKKAK